MVLAHVAVVLLAAWLAFSTSEHLGASRLSWIADREHGSPGHAIAMGGQMLMTAVLSRRSALAPARAGSERAVYAFDPPRARRFTR
jgi:hypothetical protein